MQECWVWMRFHSCNGSGGCGVQLSLPSPAMPNSATHLRVGIVSWYEFNEMEKSAPSNFIHVKHAQTHWTSSLADFPLQRNIEWVSPFFCFVSKGSNQFETQLGFSRRLKANQALDILSEKKSSLPMERPGGTAVLLRAPRGWMLS